MFGSCAFMCIDSAQNESIRFYDRHPELGSKWDKAFWARGYYVVTIGNVTEEAIKKYIEEQSEESRKEDNYSRF